MSDSRFSFVAYLTVPSSLTDAVASHIGELLSKRFGGATIMPASGFWAHDGSQVKDQYGPVQKEGALAIHLSVLTPQADQALTCLQDAAKSAKNKFGLEAKAFHIEKWQTTAHHTDLSQA